MYIGGGGGVCRVYIDGAGGVSRVYWWSVGVYRWCRWCIGGEGGVSVVQVVSVVYGRAVERARTKTRDVPRSWKEGPWAASGSGGDSGADGGDGGVVVLMLCSVIPGLWCL